MQQNKNGQIEPDHKDFLQYHLSHAKDESSYISNSDIADMITVAFEEKDIQDIINLLTN